MKAHTLVSVSLIMLIVTPIYSQESTKNLEAQKHYKSLAISSQKDMYKDAFPSTMWMPNSGVSLLKEKSARKVWKNWSKEQEGENKCHLEPIISSDTGIVLSSFFVFKTEKMYFFVYSHNQQHNPQNLIWTICNRETGHEILNSMGYDSGYDYENPSITGNDTCGGPSSRLSFRQLTKGGDLFIEALVGRCQTDENHHELLFKIVGEKLIEVPNSRIYMDHHSRPDEPWSWWYVGKKYNPRKVIYNDDGEGTWSRLLYKRPSNLNDNNSWAKAPMSLYRRTCRYNKDTEDLICEEELLRKAEIKDYESYGYTNGNASIEFMKRQIKDVEEYRNAGFIIRDKDVTQLKEYYHERKKRQKK